MTFLKALSNLKVKVISKYFMNGSVWKKVFSKQLC